MSYVIRRNGFTYDSQQKWEKSIYNILNRNIFLNVTVEQKHLPTSILMLGIARIIFNITPIGFVWKKKVMYT